jgi:hypothetical protein
VLTFPNDTHEIFAHAAEARSFAVGAQRDVHGSFQSAEQVDLSGAPYFFTNDRADHSAQFMSTNMRRWIYWATLLDQFGL